MEPCAALQQCRGEAVAEGVRTDVLLDARRGRGLLDVDEDRDARDDLATSAEEDVLLLAPLGGRAVGVCQIAPQLTDGGVAQRHQALLAPLAQHTYVAFVEEGVGEAQMAGFAHA